MLQLWVIESLTRRLPSSPCGRAWCGAANANRANAARSGPPRPAGDSTGCGGAARPGPPPATSGPSSCRSTRPSTSSPPRASSGSALDLMALRSLQSPAEAGPTKHHAAGLSSRSVAWSTIRHGAGRAGSRGGRSPDATVARLLDGPCAHRTNPAMDAVTFSNSAPGTTRTSSGVRTLTTICAKSSYRRCASSTSRRATRTASTRSGPPNLSHVGPGRHDAPQGGATSAPARSPCA